MTTRTTFIIIHFIFILILNLQPSKAQPWEWSKTLESSGNCKVYGITSDHEGNTIITGNFSGTIRFNNTPFTSQGAHDIFVAKYNPGGNLIWAKQAGGPDEEEVYGIACDRNGNVLVTGYFTGFLNIDDISMGNGLDITDKNCVVIKYDKDGIFKWALRSNGAGDKYGKAVTTDKDGNVFFTGVFKNEISFFAEEEHEGAAERGEHPEEEEELVLKSKSASNIFIVKVAPNNKFLWIKHSDGTGINEPSAIETDNGGNCYITGAFSDECAFDSTKITSKGNQDIFLTKIDPVGKVVWAKRAGGSRDNDQSSGIAKGADGHIYLTGYFSGPASFGKRKLKCRGGSDIFVTKINPDGNTVWAKRAGGQGNEYSRGIELDQKGNIYVAGEFNSSFDFTNNKISNSGDWDIFVLKFSEGGKTITGYHAGGKGSDKGIGLTVNGQSHCFVLGTFGQEGGSGSTGIKNDVFIAKIKE